MPIYTKLPKDLPDILRDVQGRVPRVTSVFVDDARICYYSDEELTQEELDLLGSYSPYEMALAPKTPPAPVETIDPNKQPPENM